MFFLIQRFIAPFLIAFVLLAFVHAFVALLGVVKTTMPVF